MREPLSFNTPSENNNVIDYVRSFNKSMLTMGGKFFKTPDANSKFPWGKQNKGVVQEQSISRERIVKWVRYGRGASRGARVVVVIIIY